MNIRHSLIYIFLSFSLLTFAQSSDNQLDDFNYFNVVADYQNDSIYHEGGYSKYIYKQSKFWNERLFPSGDPSIIGQGVVQYVKNFHENKIECHNGNWTCLGPTGRPAGRSNSKGTGQIHTLKFSPNYGLDKVVYAGTNFGGIWKRTGDNPWKPLNSDTQLAINSVSDIEIDPSDLNRIYISTGDAEIVMGHHAQKENGGVSKHTPLFTSGMYRTDDGGLNWKPINGKNDALLDYFINGGTIRKIRMHPYNSKTLFIATSVGVFKTLDATIDFPEWVLIANDISDAQLKGLEFKPNDPKVMYSSGYDVYRSNDEGNTWSSITGRTYGLDFSDFSDDFRIFRINIAVTKANPEVLYAYIIGDDDVSTGRHKLTFYLYKFDGKRWHLIHHPSRQDGSGIVTPTRSALIVSPNDENEVYFGTTKLYGGKNITKETKALSPYTSNEFHADVHAMEFEPWSNNLFVGTDGGVHVKDLSKENNGGWKDISDGLQISTIYKFDNVDDAKDRIIIGNQDCGTYVFQDDEWRIIAGGDGFNGEVDGKSGIAFFSNAHNSLSTYDFNKKIRNGKLRYASPRYEERFLPKEPTGSTVKVRGVFDMINHPKTEKLIFSMSELFERQINGEAPRKMKPSELWKVKSDFGKVVKKMWKRQSYVFDIAASNPNYILASNIGIVVDQPLLYKEGFSIQPKLYRSVVGGCDGQLDYESNACFEDITQKLIDSGVKLEHYQPVHEGVPTISIPVISGAVFNPEDHLQAWVGFTGYEKGMKIWSTKDGGDSWFNADSTGSLQNIPVNCMVHEKGSNEMIYLGTDAGIYYKDSKMSDWVKYCDFPNVRVTDMNINYCMGKIRASTFGRGLWEGELKGKSTDLGITELIIDEETTWDFNRGLDRNLRVKSGARLTIRGTPDANTTFSMPKNGKIIVEAGATLRVIHASITNNCDEIWKGIEVHGDSTACQMKEFQGFVYLQNAVISNADVGLFIGKSGDDSKTGGIVNAYKSTFEKNEINIMSIQYLNPSSQGRHEGNATMFEGCEFGEEN